MRAVIQRVLHAGVRVAGVEVSRIGKGILVLLGVAGSDCEQDCCYLAEKTANLRIFSDNCDKMNLSVLDIGGEILVVSQFTLYGDCRKGRRPSYAAAAAPESAAALYDRYVKELCEYTPRVSTGRFREMMEVFLVNDGPVTLLLDSRKEF
jgi:D-tyrosyl-tRNA(Tyr) deacylase